MFQPNSIKTLRDLKLQNQLERGELTEPLSKNDEFINTNLDGMRESLKQMNQNPIQLMMQNKSLLKDVNNSIEDVRTWRENQRQNLESTLKQNQIDASKNESFKSCLNDMDEEDKEEEEYNKKCAKSKQRFEQLGKDLKLDVRPSQQYTQTQMSSNAKTDYVNRKLAASDLKLSQIEVEKVMGLLEYSSVMHNKDITAQIEREYSLTQVDDHLNHELAQYDEVIDILLQQEQFGSVSLVKDTKQQKQILDLVTMKEQSVQLIQQSQDRSEHQKQISKDLEEIDDDMAEIDKLMKEYGVQ